MILFCSYCDEFFQKQCFLPQTNLTFNKSKRFCFFFDPEAIYLIVSFFVAI